MSTMITNTLVPLDALDPDPLNARSLGPDKDAVASIAASFASLGQIQAILVRPNPSADGRYLVTVGRTRVEAARKLGWTEIAAVIEDSDGDNASFAALSAAENIVRSPMHPVDAWRAVKSLVDRNMTIEQAADALGLPLRYAKRLEKLGSVIPEILDIIAGADGLPNETSLATIASAPPEVQRKALAAATTKDRVDFFKMRGLCQIERIPQARAIFDVETAGVVFEEDLFAEEDDEDRYTTSDVQGFMKAQAEALQKRADDPKSHVIITQFDEHGGLKAPPGHVLIWDAVPKRWTKKDQRRIAAAIYPNGYQIGAVIERMCAPRQKAADTPATTQSAAKASTERAPVTKAVQDQLAALKTLAIRKAATAFAEQAGSEDMLRALLLVFAADNVSISDAAHTYGRHGSYRSIVAQLIGDDGEVRRTGSDELHKLAAEVIARTAIVTSPNAFSGSTSGQAAEWIGRFVGANDFLDRCDTEEVLRGFRGDKLVEIARQFGISDTGKVSDVRKRLVGKIPDWRPAGFEPEAFKPGWRDTPVADGGDDDDDPEDGEE